MPRGIIYTIGYSSYTRSSLIKTLYKHDVKAVIDVRSSPFSSIYKDFNRSPLKAELNQKNIYYVFLGAECGARVEDRSCHTNGKVDFQKVNKLPSFKKGITRILSGSEIFNVTLFCAEKDPITCHRMILVCRELAKYDVEIKHILPNCDIESHDEAEARLLAKLGLNQMHFFKSKEEVLEEGYKIQGEKIAYDFSKEDSIWTTHEQSNCTP